MGEAWGVGRDVEMVRDYGASVCVCVCVCVCVFVVGSDYSLTAECCLVGIPLIRGAALRRHALPGLFRRRAALSGWFPVEDRGGYAGRAEAERAVRPKLAAACRERSVRASYVGIPDAFRRTPSDGAGRQRASRIGLW
eukprot:COSAG02_NODE_6888_length_3306_cov_3.325538_6_plen_138_part_00